MRRLRAAITRVTRHRINEERTMEDKIKYLIEDFKNAPSHVFGEHARCKALNYFKCDTNIEENHNYVDEMKNCGLYEDIEACLFRLILNVRSLLLDMDNNLAEHYNSIVCKFVGGKRVNFALKGSYQTRCEAASISFNAKSEYHRVVDRAFTQKSPKRHTKLYIQKIKNRQLKWSKRKLFIKNNIKRKIRVPAPADNDYGPEANLILSADLSQEEFIKKRDEFMNSMKKSEEQIILRESKTRGQRTSDLWRNERCIRLTVTASNFGKICKLRPTTSCVNTVKALLYSNFVGNKHTRYGIRSEPLAKKQFETEFQLQVVDCGLFIHPIHFYLGASPDGLIGKNKICN